MSDAMTLEEAVAWRTTGSLAYWNENAEAAVAMNATERSALVTQWIQKHQESDAALLAHAERTLAARSGEPQDLPFCACETYYKAHHPNCPVRQYFDHLTARLAEVKRERTKCGDWCEDCNAPQWVVGDGSHHCATMADLCTERDALAAVVERVKAANTILDNSLCTLRDHVVLVGDDADYAAKVQEDADAALAKARAALTSTREGK